MATTNEPAKLLLPYLQRADELQVHDPLVAYYCRLYAIERGLKIPQSERTETTNSLLVSLMNQLEKHRKSLKLSPDDHLHLEGFALNVFAKADKQDRAGRADMNTAKTFYAASIFFETLNQFGELAPDLEQKQQYAAWKAADTRKALKEGRKPVPGPPGGETDLSTPSTPSGCNDVEPQHARNDTDPSSQPDPTPPQLPHGLKRHASTNVEPSTQVPDGLKRQTTTNIQPSPPPFANGDCSSHTADSPSFDHQYAHPSSRPDDLNYSQMYHGQSYPQEPRQPPHIPQNYPSQDMSASYAYPNFQSYPSFSESSLPASPLHYPSFSHGSNVSYSHQPGPSPSVTNYSSTPQCNPSSRDESAPDAPASLSQTFDYNSNYQPPPEKIAEAQKAARFAVGALAFDEVPVAVEHLRKALEYLTIPSAGQ